MSNRPNDPHATDDAFDDLDAPADEADAVSGGITFNASEDDDRDPQGTINAI